MAMTNNNHKFRREKEIRICEDLNNLSYDEIKKSVYRPIPIEDGLFITLTLVYRYMFNSELKYRGLEESKIVLNNVRPFRCMLYSAIKEIYGTKKLQTSQVYKSKI